ncbi:MAG: ParA family protein [Bacteroidetes bacterium]|nr:ParA family protein [Bacteroidota bacterium]
MFIFTVINNKGGVGKTTSAQNLGGALSKYSKAKTLIIDLDPQSSLTKGFRISENERQVGDFLLNKVDIESIKFKYDDYLDILPSSFDLLNQEQMIANSPAFPFNLKSNLSKIKDAYNFVIIDCPPALSSLTRIALMACDFYLIPTQAEYFSYEGLRSLINFTNQLSAVNPSMKLGGVFATRFNPNIKKRFSQEIITSIKEQLKDKFLKTYIRENIALTESQAKGKHIFDYNDSSNGAKDYHSLAKELLAKII